MVNTKLPVISIKIYRKNTFHSLLYGVGTCPWKEMFYLTTNSTHFIYVYTASERAHGKYPTDEKADIVNAIVVCIANPV